MRTLRARYPTLFLLVAPPMTPSTASPALAPSPSPAPETRPAARLLLALLRRSRGTLAFALMACVANGGASVALIATLEHALAAPPSGAGRLGLGFAACALVALFSRVSSGVLFARLSQDAISHLRLHMANRVAAAELRELERIGAAPVQSVLTDDATNVSMLFFALPNLVMHGSIVVGCLGYLAYLSLPVCALALAAIAIGSLGYRLGDARALAALDSAGRAQDRLFDHLGALFSGAKELRLHRERARQFLHGGLGAAVDEVREHRRRAFTAYAAGVGWIVFLFYVFLGAATFAPSFASHAGTRAAASYVIVFLFMLVPLDGLLNNIPTLTAARLSLSRIERVLADFGVARGASGDAHTQPRAQAAPVAPSFRSLALRGVTHAYVHERDERLFRVGPIDLAFTPGEVVFLVGGNGSGKTTLAKLIAGLYVPETGVVEVDGVRIDATSLPDYREHFSAVFNDFHLFDTLMGIVDPTKASHEDVDARANALLVKLSLDHKVRVERGTFSTRALSTGQRKRLALVVAYLEDRPFYLFDEWAADQDPSFKAVFYEQLLPELRARGKTVLVITHDDRYFGAADRIVKLENGSIVSEIRS